MKVYLYLPDSSTESTASAALYLERISSMHKGGYLPADATVWANATDYGMGMWVLGESSTHVRVHDSIVAGWARITRSTVRFAPNLDDTTTDPTRTFDLLGVPTETKDKPRSTILVHHVQPTKRVQFVANSQVFKTNAGICEFDPFTVIDMHHYKGPEHASKNPVEQAHAMINGVALMTQGLEPNTAEFVRGNIDAFAIEMNDDALTFVGNHSDKLTEYARRWAEQFQVNVKALGGLHPARA